MIKILQEYRVDPMIVNLIKQIYTNDSTTLYLNTQKVIDIEITSGIRQGCNMSALLFILVTYKIIEDIDKFNKGYNDEQFKILSLFIWMTGLYSPMKKIRWREYSIVYNRQVKNMDWSLIKVNVK